MKIKMKIMFKKSMKMNMNKKIKKFKNNKNNKKNKKNKKKNQ